MATGEDQVSQHSSMYKGVPSPLPSLAEELVTVDGCWRCWTGDGCSLKVLPLVRQSCSVGGSHTHEYMGSTNLTWDYLNIENVEVERVWGCAR